jgi:hypothetical protein
MLKLRCKWTVRGVVGFAIQSVVPSVGPVRTRTYLMYIPVNLRAPRTGPLYYPCVLGYPGQVSLSLLPAAEPRALETILAALLCD